MTTRSLSVTLRSPSRLLATALALAATLTVAGCSGSGAAPKGSPTPYPGQSAAEPATAPTPSVAPSGKSLSVGSAAEGAVYDDQTSTLAVLVRDRNQLVLLDGVTLNVRRRIGLPGKGRHLALAAAGGPLLIADEGSDSLLQVPIDCGSITQTKTGHFPHDAAQASNGTIFVADEGGRALTVVRAGKAIKTFTDVAQPAGVATIGNTVGVIDAKGYTMSTYDAQTLTRTARVAAGKGPTHVVATDAHQFVATDTRGNALLVYDSSPLKLSRRIALPGSPYGLSYDTRTNRVWVTLVARNQVVSVNPRTGAVDRRLPTVQQPNTVAVSATTGSVYVIGAAAGVVQQIRTTDR